MLERMAAIKLNKRTLPPALSLKVGELVTHHVCGVGRVVEDRGDLLVVQCVRNKLYVKKSAPTVRRLISRARAAEIRKVLASRAPVTEPLDERTWYQRYRDFAAGVRSGDLNQILNITRILRGKGRSLKFGERRMLNWAEGILEAELRAVEQPEKFLPAQ